jgi:hypothetical protein
MNRQNSTGGNACAIEPAKKPLSVRYAEVLALRQAILQIEAAGKANEIARPASK